MEFLFFKSGGRCLLPPPLPPLLPPLSCFPSSALIAVPASHAPPCRSAKTPLANFVTGIVVMLTLLVLTPIFTHMSSNVQVRAGRGCHTGARVWTGRRYWGHMRVGRAHSHHPALICLSPTSTVSPPLLRAPSSLWECWRCWTTTNSSTSGRWVEAAATLVVPAAMRGVYAAGSVAALVVVTGRTCRARAAIRHPTAS